MKYYQAPIIILLIIIIIFTSQIGYGQVTRPGTYSWYTFAEKQAFYNLDIYSRWEAAPVSGKVFSSLQFSFQAGSGGYIGTQINDTRKLVLFSIWDMKEDNMTAQPTGDCVRFGGEGTGAKCQIEYDWVVGREYRLRIWQLNADTSGEQWIGTIYDTVTDQETTIGIIKLFDSNNYKGYGWIKSDNMVTWIEYFSGPAQCIDQPYVRVLWRGPYANNNSYIANSAIARYISGCNLNNVISPGRPIVIHEAGGTTQATTKSSTDVWKILLHLPIVKKDQ